MSAGNQHQQQPQAEVCDMACNGTGRLLAVAKEDGNVTIYDIGNNAQSQGRSDTGTTPLGELVDMLLPEPTSGGADGGYGGGQHQQPPAAILKVAWADHRLPGNLLLTGSIDGVVSLWKDIKGDRKWVRVYIGQRQPSAIVGLSWADLECGLTCFAAATSAGPLLVCTANKDKDDEWFVSQVEGHQAHGCNACSFCPILPPSSLISSLPIQQTGAGGPNGGGRGGAQGGAQQQHQQQQLGGTGVLQQYPRLATAGNERGIRVWRYAMQDRQWLQERELIPEANNTAISSPGSSMLNPSGASSSSSSSAKVLDVAWAPNYGLPFTYIASAGDDGVVNIFFQDGFDGKWQSCSLPIVFPAPAVRVSWSLVGTYLSVACADGAVSIWREQKTGEWVRAADVPQSQ